MASTMVIKGEPELLESTTTYHLQQLQPVPPIMTQQTSSITIQTNSENEFECEICEYKTFRKSNMTQHVKTVHDRIKDFACNRCDYKSARRSNVNYHIKTVHENIKDYACQFCNFKSARKYNVVQHTERVHKNEIQAAPNGTKFVHCTKLDNNSVQAQVSQTKKRSRKKQATASQSFTNTPQIVSTLMSQQPVPRVTVQLQPQVSSIPAQVVQQQQQPQQNNGSTSTILTSTNSSFNLDPPTMVNPSYASMTLNYAHHQPMYNSPPTLTSNQPSPQQQNQSTQQNNLNNSTVVSMNNFTSPLPPMNFTSLQPIQYNQLNQPTFSVSPVTTTVPNTMVTSNSNKKEKKEFACTFCPFKSNKKKNLSQHLQSVHGANPVPNYTVVPGVVQIAVKNSKANADVSPSGKPKNFACNFCDFRTAYRRNLNSHINEVHLHDRREHKCHICDFNSTRKSNLAQHIKSVHERVKDHHCWLCGFTSTRKRNVEKHVLAMHLQKDQILNQVKVTSKMPE